MYKENNGWDSQMWPLVGKNASFLLTFSFLDGQSEILPQYRNNFPDFQSFAFWRENGA